ncbi:rhodanese domain-containing protein CG4456 [Neodiprion lecontei]|uniref:Rhodanese domain-containing protein CG4456 n=1 Tax=Neodiprion lecontei TaxID=441921 RepID=A0A6J0BRR6_NEOLC|nr:rhodanese domain-containing protein CG4456 [Neodiprion lecontei]
MMSSKRITGYYHQVVLSRFRSVNQRRYSLMSNNLVKNICGAKNLTQTYRSTLIAERDIRNISIATRLLAQTKVMKGEGDHGLNLNYEDILKAQKDDKILIVDVREDEEIKETGKLPGSIHIPMGEAVNAITNLPEKEFFDRYQKPKPTKDTKLIFSCRSGKRSATVQEEMLKQGYEKSYNYTGGWLDWESKQAPTA